MHLLEPGVDAVTIAAPTHLHHEVALDCIARGVHVLVEKPIASNVEEGATIIAAAKRHGVTLMVGHVERFNPAVQAIKEAIRGEDILSIGITRVGPFPPRMSNVGVVIDLAVHDIDLIRWFTDSDIVEVQPQTVERGGRARGHRAAAIPHRLGRARAHQHQLADAVQGAHASLSRRASKYLIGDLLTRQVTRMLRLPAGRQLIRCGICRSAIPSRCAPSFSPSSMPCAAARRRRSPARRASQASMIAMRCLEDRPPARWRPAFRTAPRRRADRLIALRAEFLYLMNQPARIDSRPIPFIDVAAQRRRHGHAPSMTRRRAS